MNDYPHPIIAREGWPFLGISFGFGLMVTASAGLAWAAPIWIFFIFCLQFFRDPPREVPGDANSVLSPVDGRVIAIEPTRDPWRNCDTLKISVFMNVFNVHSQRSPVDGQVVEQWYHRGAFLNAALAKASIENERNALHIRTATGHDITCTQVAGLVALRILCYVNPGAGLARGQRYGFIRFGSRVDLYLPTDSRVKVTIGDKVRATSTLLAELP
jgi:phosphatidylserine decarboxylase